MLGMRSSYLWAFYLAFSLRFLSYKVIPVRPGIVNIPE